jgi:hypothetical protein
MNAAMTYEASGLKYETSFGDTHLGRRGRRDAR